MTITTRLTEKLDIKHPVISAPMAFASGGRLAAAVTDAGGLGLIGGGYCDGDWIENQIKQTGNRAIGCGFITWVLKDNPSVLDSVLEHAPKAIFLSFGNPDIFSKKIKQAGSELICQVQTLKDAKHAVDCGADIIVAQGGEAGGHGQGGSGSSKEGGAGGYKESGADGYKEGRGTLTIVPEVADWLANNAPQVLLCAAGGIGDGRGLAASLMLGADGALVGSRFWASKEALVHKNMHDAAINSAGDDTIRSSVMDIARKIDWPNRYSARVLQNDFTRKWHGQENDLIDAGTPEADKWRTAWVEGNTDIANTFVGEVTGIIGDIRPAAQILDDMVSQAKQIISRTYKSIK